MRAVDPHQGNPRPHVDPDRSEAPMSISSLVIDVADSVAGRAALLAIADDPRFTLGPANGTRHALVLDTPSIADDTDAYDWLRDLPGVAFITLVSAYLDDEILPAGAAAHYL
jgi:hypothetical protein